MTEIDQTAPFGVARLSPSDVALLRQLLSVFGKVFDDVDTYGRHQPRQSYLEDMLACGDFIALAALAGDDVVGGLVAYELRKFEQERSEIYIYDLAVDAAHR